MLTNALQHATSVKQLLSSPVYRSKGLVLGLTILRSASLLLKQNQNMFPLDRVRAYLLVEFMSVSLRSDYVTTLLNGAAFQTSTSQDLKAKRNQTTALSHLRTSRALSGLAMSLIELWMAGYVA